MGPEDKLLGQVNADNPPLALTTTDVTIGEVSDLPSGLSETRLTAIKGSGYRGGVKVRYRRLGLGKLFQFFTPSVKAGADGVLTTEELLARIASKYGVVLTPAEVVVSDLVLDEGYFYLIEAKPGSLIYTESMTIRVDFGQTDISEVVMADYNSFVYPTEFPEEAVRLIDAALYSGGWLVPECFEELSVLLVGTPADENLAWLTQTLSGDDWVMDDTNPQENNLGGAVVSYNGPVVDFKTVEGDDITLMFKPEGGVAKVVALTLDPALCTNMAGRLTFFY